MWTHHKLAQGTVNSKTSPSPRHRNTWQFSRSQRPFECFRQMMGMTKEIENLNWPLFSWGNDCFNESGCGRWRRAWLRHLFWGPNSAEAAFLPTWTINDHHTLSGVGRCWKYVQIWETTWETHMSARQNLRHSGTITIHQDIDTWYYHETLRNDGGDTKKNDHHFSHVLSRM